MRKARSHAPAAAPPARPEPATPSVGRPRLIALLASLGAAAFAVAYAVTAWWPGGGDGGAPPGMVRVPGGTFTMGSAGKALPRSEQPAHEVRVDGFWMDETEVTNAQFRAFVEATGYVTTAEKKPDWESLKRQSPPGTPRPPDDKLVPGSMVFTPP